MVQATEWAARNDEFPISIGAYNPDDIAHGHDRLEVDVDLRGHVRRRLPRAAHVLGDRPPHPRRDHLVVEDQSRLDGLAQPHFISQEVALKRILQDAGHYIDLVFIKINARRQQAGVHTPQKFPAMIRRNNRRKDLGDARGQA